mmetsp:Transcript_11900/g.32286  ORF Transcript_11900/g.32286 Transcript_11900/m.32286 type:complete len:292 (+) Transcript_11900:488-1363(+)
MGGPRHHPLQLVAHVEPRLPEHGRQALGVPGHVEAVLPRTSLHVRAAPSVLPLLLPVRVGQEAAVRAARSEEARGRVEQPAVVGGAQVQGLGIASEPQSFGGVGNRLVGQEVVQCSRDHIGHSIVPRISKPVWNIAEVQVTLQSAAPKPRRHGVPASGLLRQARHEKRVLAYGRIGRGSVEAAYALGYGIREHRVAERALHVAALARGRPLRQPPGLLPGGHEALDELPELLGVQDGEQGVHRAVAVPEAAVRGGEAWEDPPCGVVRGEVDDLACLALLVQQARKLRGSVK